MTHSHPHYPDIHHRHRHDGSSSELNSADTKTDTKLVKTSSVEFRRF
jgi:hypothetical protein